MRKLASVQVIDKLYPIPGADAIEAAGILGWKAVVKKGEFKEGDKCVYFEIDSLLPRLPWSEFLFEKASKLYDGKYRLKTIKLRGTYSQGLIVPIFSIFPATHHEKQVGDDVTEELAITKYEPTIPPQLRGDANAFTWPITKTDEERIQSNPYKYLRDCRNKIMFPTVKLDGTSASYILTEKEDGTLDFHVCSRNLSLKYKEGNTYWAMNEKYKIRERLETIHKEIRENGEKDGAGALWAFQGEICGPGIQGNPLGLTEHHFYIFNIVDVRLNAKLPPAGFNMVKRLAQETEAPTFYGLEFVPEFDKEIRFEGGDFRDEESIKEYVRNTVDDLLNLVKRDYKDFGFPNSSKPIEGVVFRCSVQDPESDNYGIFGDEVISFKVINNDYKEEE